MDDKMVFVFPKMVKIVNVVLAVISAAVVIFFVFGNGGVLSGAEDSDPIKRYMYLVLVVCVFVYFVCSAIRPFVGSVTVDDEGFTERKLLSSSRYEFSQLDSVDCVNTYSSIDGGISPVTFYMKNGAKKRVSWKYERQNEFVAILKQKDVTVVMVENSRNIRR